MLPIASQHTHPPPPPSQMQQPHTTPAPSSLSSPTTHPPTYLPKQPASSHPPIATPAHPTLHDTRPTPPAPPLRSSAPGSKHQQHIGASGHLLAMCAATRRARASRYRCDTMRCAWAHAAKQASPDLQILGPSQIRPVTVRTHLCRSAKPLPCFRGGVGKADAHPGGLAGSLKRSSDMLGCQIPIPWRGESYDG